MGSNRLRLSRAPAELNDAGKLETLAQHLRVDGLIVAVKVLVRRLHLDIWNADSRRVDVVGSANDANLGLDLEVVVVFLAVDDGDVAVIGSVVVVVPGTVGVSDDHMARRGALDAVVYVAAHTIHAHVGIVGSRETRESGGRDD